MFDSERHRCEVCGELTKDFFGCAYCGKDDSWSPRGLRFYCNTWLHKYVMSTKILHRMRYEPTDKAS